MRKYFIICADYACSSKRFISDEHKQKFRQTVNKLFETGDLAFCENRMHKDCTQDINSYVRISEDLDSGADSSTDSDLEINSNQRTILSNGFYYSDDDEKCWDNGEKVCMCSDLCDCERHCRCIESHCYDQNCDNENHQEITYVSHLMTSFPIFRASDEPDSLISCVKLCQNLNFCHIFSNWVDSVKINKVITKNAIFYEIKIDAESG